VGVKDSTSPGYPEVRRLSATSGGVDVSWGASVSLTAFGTMKANTVMSVFDACLLGDGRLAVAGSKALDAGGSQTQIVAVAANGAGQSLFADLGNEDEPGSAALGMTTLGSGAGERVVMGYLRRAAGSLGRDGNRIRMSSLRTADGAADTSFSGDGQLDVAYQTPTLDQSLAAFPGPDGTTYTVINAHMTTEEGSVLGAPLDSRRYLAVVRQRADGLKDPLFGSGGSANLELHADGSHGAPRHGAIAPDGGIIAATELRLFRFTPGGTQDMAFGGGDGEAQSSNANDRIQRVLVQPDGKILAFGRVSGQTNLVVMRFTAAGALDSGFGSAGRRTFAGNTAGDLALQADGSILALCIQSIGGSNSPAVVRLTAAGAIDTAWGASGSVALPKAGYSAGAVTRLIAVPSGGWIAMGSLVTPPTERRSAVWRFGADGSLVSGFGSSGVAVHNVAPMGAGYQIETERFTSGLVDAGRGLLYLTGDSERVVLDSSGLADGSESRAWVARLALATGALDTGFASNGMKIWDTAAYPDAFPANQPMALSPILPSGDSGRLRLVGDLREDTVLLRMLVGTVQAAAAPVITQGAQVAVTMSEDGSPTPFSLALTASDADSTDLSWSVAEQPANGTVSISASASGGTANPVYTPSPDWFGSDSFVMVVSDGFLTDSIRVDVTVNPVDDVVGGTPDISVSVLGAVRSDGATVAAGNAVVGAAPLNVPIRLANAGTANLVLLSTALATQTNCSASLVGTPPSGLAPGNGSDLVIAISPTSAGAWSCVLLVSAQDPDEPTTSITITGQGLAVTAPVVTIAASDGIASEGSGTPDTGTLVLTRSGSTAAALSVNVGLAGSTATAGADYSLTPGGASSVVTFAAGSATATVTVTAVDDAVAEGEEFVRLTILSGTGYAPGAVASAEVAIIDSGSGTTPSISIVASDAAAAEVATGGIANNGAFTLSRTGSTASALTVDLAISGAAVNGTDYSTIPATATFAAGSSSVAIPITVLDDAATEGTEAVILGIQAGSGYAVGSPASASVTIIDNESGGGSAGGGAGGGGGGGGGGCGAGASAIAGLLGLLTLRLRRRRG
jgi:uncharacterized delta-60 repeat protein